MSIGTCLVLACDRHFFASDNPLCAGSIQSSRMTSGSTASSSRCAASPSIAQIGWKPLWRKLTAISSAMAGSSSTIRTRGTVFIGTVSPVSEPWIRWLPWRYGAHPHL
eukprot:Amastigsp_a968_5.p3 type:complete len:108 gc:universal Amastigsp_a968_5:695-372(-)